MRSVSNMFPLYNPRMGSAPLAQAHVPHLRVHCVNVFVRDQDRSLAFSFNSLGSTLRFIPACHSVGDGLGVGLPTAPQFFLCSASTSSLTPWRRNDAQPPPSRKLNVLPPTSSRSLSTCNRASSHKFNRH